MLLQAMLQRRNGKKSHRFSYDYSHPEMCLAVELFLSLYHHKLMLECAELLFPTDDDASSKLSDVEKLEEGAIILTDSLWTTNDFTETPTQKRAEVRSALEKLASLVQSQIAEQGGDRVKAAITTLLNISSGDTANYYYIYNSSIKRVLKERSGIPVTLAVVYKCILRRLGIESNLMGLSFHVVLGLPNGNYVDLFRGGRFLTVDDCSQHPVWFL
jgi:hypothetical protein